MPATGPKETPVGPTHSGVGGGALEPGARAGLVFGLLGPGRLLLIPTGQNRLRFSSAKVAVQENVRAEAILGVRNLKSPTFGAGWILEGGGYPALTRWTLENHAARGDARPGAAGRAAAYPAPTMVPAKVDVPPLFLLPT